MLSPLQVQLLRPGARLPAQATPGSAGYDLCACLPGPVTVNPGETALVPTGIAIDPGPGVAAFVFGRSGLGIRHNVVPANAVGVVDSDYRGELMVGLINQGRQPYTIQPGERIAQLVLLPVLTPPVAAVDGLGQTQRGAGGLGSTGRL